MKSTLKCGNIWAIGRNYATHAKELGNEVPKEPFFFLKAGSCLVAGSPVIRLPSWIEEVHHEVELGLRFGSDLRIDKAAVALDLTERNLQNQLKAKGLPWTLAKSFTNACPVSEFFPVGSVSELQDLELRLSVNGELRQQGRTSQMIFSLEQQIEFVQRHFPVSPGDLLLTGTPAGVGPVRRGDQLVAEITDKIQAGWRIE